MTSSTRDLKVFGCFPVTCVPEETQMTRLPLTPSSRGTMISVGRCGTLCRGALVPCGVVLWNHVVQWCYDCLFCDANASAVVYCGRCCGTV